MPEWETRCPIRSVYVAPQFWNWVDGRDDIHEIFSGGRSIFEHIELMLIDLRCAKKPPGADELRRMTPHPDGVYRLQPEGSRVYGWMPEKGTFVLVSADTKAAFKTDFSLYEHHRKGVVDFRRHLGLNANFLTGDYRALFEA